MNRNTRGFDGVYHDLLYNSDQFLYGVRRIDGQLQLRGSSVLDSANQGYCQGDALQLHGDLLTVPDRRERNTPGFCQRLARDVDIDDHHQADVSAVLNLSDGIWYEGQSRSSGVVFNRSTEEDLTSTDVYNLSQEEDSQDFFSDDDRKRYQTRLGRTAHQVVGATNMLYNWP